MKSYIVKLNETGRYFKVEYEITTIRQVSLVGDKRKATIFQDSGNETIAPNGIDIISWNKIRSKEFSLYLYFKGIKSDDITIEELDAKEQPLLTKNQKINYFKYNKIYIKHN